MSWVIHVTEILSETVRDHSVRSEAKIERRLTISIPAPSAGSNASFPGHWAESADHSVEAAAP